MLSNYLISLIRTGVTVAVGALLTWLATSLHIVVDPTSQAGLVAVTVGVLSGAYYALARLAESKVPALGVLLGVPTAPTYTSGNPSGVPAGYVFPPTSDIEQPRAPTMATNTNPAAVTVSTPPPTTAT